MMRTTVQPDRKAEDHGQNADAASRPLVLVTGARGKLARHIVPQLAPHCRLRLTDLAPSTEDGYTQADLTEFAGLEDLFSGVDTLVHLAIASEPPERDPEVKDRLDPFDEMILRVNVQAVNNVFEAARRAGVRKIVFASSMTILWGNRHLPHYDHLSPLEPKNLYACSKIFGESLARVYHRDYGLSVICLRIGQPYPIGSAADELWQTNRRSRSIYVTVNDITRAVLCALRTKHPFGIYPIVSASDNPRIDVSSAREIGFVPEDYFAEDRLEKYPDGQFPPVPGPVTCH